MILIIDSHVHAGGPPEIAEPDKFVKLMDKFGIDNAVIFRWFYNEPSLKANKFILNVARKFPNHYTGFAWIDPSQKNAADELQTAIIKWKLKGVKLHLEMHQATIDQLRESFSRIESLEIPVIVHLGADFSFIKALCNEYKVPIIIAHLGTGVYRLDIERLKKAIEIAQKSNVFLETSGNTFPFVDYAVKAIGAEKIILGSDFPHEHPMVCIKMVELLELSENKKDLILGLNAKNILDL